MHIQQCVKNRIGLISITGTRRKRTNCRKSRTCPQKKRRTNRRPRALDAVGPTRVRVAWKTFSHTEPDQYISIAGRQGEGGDRSTCESSKGGQGERNRAKRRSPIEQPAWEERSIEAGESCDDERAGGGGDHAGGEGRRRGGGAAKS